MIPVMIVDDELIVRVALKSIVDWEAMGFCIVGEAKNGKEGLERYRQTHPRLILTDVMMPEMTGLEMMDEIRKEDAKVCFIVLSAYDEFKFAQQAVRMHAEEYILKATMLEEDLSALLRRMFQRLTATEKAEETVHQEGESIIQLLAEGTIPPDAQSLFRETSLEAMFCRFAGVQRAEQDHRILISIAENILHDYGLRYMAGRWNHGVLLILEELPAKPLEQLTARMCDTVKQYLAAVLRIGLSNAPGNLSECSRLAGEAQHASIQTLFAPKEGVCRFTVQSGVDAISGGTLRQLREYLLLQQPQQAIGVIQAQFDRVQQARDTDALYGLVLALSALLCECRGMTEPDKPERVMQIDEIDRIREYYTASVYTAVEYLRTQEVSANPYICEALHIVTTRYEEDLTLRRMADELHLSASYLGKLFFAETGRYLMDVLEATRIERACEMLAKGSKSLAEIAEAIGFSSQSYFSRQFLKNKGLTPSEYRKKILKVKEES